MARDGRLVGDSVYRGPETLRPAVKFSMCGSSARICAFQLIS
jgi:hypothetical protein